MILEIIPYHIQEKEKMAKPIRPETKIIVAQKTKEWGTQTINWVSDSLIPVLRKCSNTIAVAVFPQSDPRAFAKACNHPNTLVLLEGEENGDAIQDFLAHQKFAT